MDVVDHRTWARHRTQTMLAAGPARRVVAVMVASVDARAALDGTSGGLSSEADQALLKAWRAVAGGLLVGARTLETERYGSLIPDEDREARRAAGQEGWPRVLTISRRMDIDLDAVLSIDASLPLTVYTEEDSRAWNDGNRFGADPRATGDQPGSDVHVVSLPEVSVASVVADARERYGYDVIACEGGPHLLAAALAQGALTDLSLTLASVVLGSGPPLLGVAIPTAVPLRLAAVDAREGSVFVHYRLV